ncbi:MAG: PEP-CTERM sorting domain-containing protein [Verrucomicrobia bacterium]|nr:PEP-CTERM sorting domain-containing protein [Verrucomicrobiota bacterium]
MSPLPTWRWLVPLALLLCPLGAQVVTPTSGTIDWSNPAGWSTGRIPGGSDSPQISTGTVTVTGVFSVQSFNLFGGNLTGPGNLTITGTGSQWKGGVMTGTGILTVAAGADLEFGNNGTVSFYRGDGNGNGGRTIENFGVINWTGGGDVLGGEGGQILNRTGAVFALLSDATLGHGIGGAQPTFQNSGTFRKSAGSGTSTVSQTNFVNTGLVQAQTGTIAFLGGVTSNGGTFATTTGGAITFTGGQTFNHGTTFSGLADTIRLLGGGTTISGSLTASGLQFAGGDLYGSGTIAGSMTWTGGNWRGPFTVSFASGSSLTLDGSSDKVLLRGDGNGSGGRVLETAGTLAWQGSGAIVGGEGAGISVLGTGLLEIRNDSTYRFGIGGSLPFLNNAGTVRKLASAGTTVFESIAFTNSGVLQVLGGTLSFTASAGLANQGVVDVQGGTLLSSASGMTSTGGTFQVSTGGLLRYTGGTNTINNSTFGGTGLTEVAGGTLLANGSTITGNFRLSSGGIGGSGTLTVSSGGSFAWGGGDLFGTGTLAVASGGLLAIQGGANKTFYRGDGNGSGGRSITNAGTTTWTGSGSLRGGEGGTFSNLAGGLFDAQGDATFVYAIGGAGPTFSNAGIVRKSAGSGATSFEIPFFNAGSAESLVGTLRLAGGGSGAGQFVASGGAIEFAASYTLLDGARFLGTTAAKLTSGGLSIPALATATIGGTGAGRFSLEGGTLEGAGVLTVGSNGELVWSGGSLIGTGILRIASGGTLHVSGATDHLFYRGDGNGSGGRTIENFGHVVWSAGNLKGGEGGSFVNAAGGLLEITGGGLFGYAIGGAGPTLSNLGTIRKTAGGPTTIAQTGVTTSGLVQVDAGSLEFTSGLTSSAGTFSAAPGASLTFSGGQTFQTGTAFSGSGLMQITGGSTTISGNLSASRLVLAGGSLFGTGTITGLLEWTGGDMRGPHTLTVSPGSTLALTGGGDRTFFRGDGNGSGGRVIENFGTMVVDHAGDLRAGEGAQLINRAGGILEFRNNQTLGYAIGGATPSLLNEGLLRKAVGTGISEISGTAVTQNGTVQVATGTLRFASGLTSNGGQFGVATGALLEFTGGQTFNGGTVITGPSRISAGTTTLSGLVSFSNLEFAGGILRGTATLSTGSVEWTGGDMRGPETLTIGAGAVLRLSGGGDRQIFRGDGNGSGGRIIENQGFLIVENSGNFTGGEGAQLINRAGGVVNLRNDATLGFAIGGAPFTFTNEGSLVKSQGAGTSTIAVPFSNSGQITIASGTLVFTSSFTNNNGSIVLANGGALAASGPLNLGTAPLAGSGTITASTVTAGGLVSPGSSPGQLNIAGNLNLLSTAVTLFELGGTSQGVNYDFLNVTGTANVAGTLQLAFASGFQSAVSPAHTFTLLQSTALIGTFTNVATSGLRLFTNDGFGSFEVSYTSSAVVLSNFVPVPEPSTWLLLGVGGGVLFWRRRRR